MAKLTLDDQFVFYACYHNNSINQWIHILCVWPLLFTALVMLAYTPSFYDAQSLTSALPFSECWLINGSFFAAAFYVIYYAILERPAGLIGSCMALACYIGANYVKLHELSFGGLSTFNSALAVHVLCWLGQFYGHAFHEGRAPALLDNLWQAVSMAPLFVLLEVLFKLGYRPEFQKKVQAKVDTSIAEWKATRAQVKSKAA